MVLREPAAEEACPWKDACGPPCGLLEALERSPGLAGLLLRSALFSVSLRSVVADSADRGIDTCNRAAGDGSSTG